MTDVVELELQEAEALCLRAARGAGANPASARALVDATLSAARFGAEVVGFPHMVAYLESFRDGRINRNPVPVLTCPFPAYIASDADYGIAQLGFELAFQELVAKARSYGVAIFSQKNSYTTGELGYYVRRLADEGLVALAATNANAMVTTMPGNPAVYGTNPIAFGFPLGVDTPPLVIDQSSSATAYVNIAAAAAEGRQIPLGWAVDARGCETQDASEALAGALLPAGGRKGANLALMVEMLSAGLSGGAWSVDAPGFQAGNESPSVGLTILAMMAGPMDADHIKRAHDQIQTLKCHGVYIPGQGRNVASGLLRMQRVIHDTICSFAGLTP